MALGQLKITPDGQLKDKLEMAIDRLKAFEPEEGYFVAFSGGKDSQCIYHLCEMAGVKFDAHYSLTSVDPPELVYFIRDQYPTVSVDIPHDRDGKRISMWNLIANDTMPPTQKWRYCCEKLKEANGRGRITVTGVRWAESPRRKALHDVVDFVGKQKTTIKEAEEHGADYALNKNGYVILNDDNDAARRMVEHCYRTHKTIVNPIVDWDDGDVWEFLNDVLHVPHCSLYDDGYTRLGCIGCPMQRGKGMRQDFERWPKYKELYLKAFERMIQNRRGGDWISLKYGNDNKPDNMTLREKAEDMFDWWININH